MTDMNSYYDCQNTLREAKQQGNWQEIVSPRVPKVNSLNSKVPYVTA